MTPLIYYELQTYLHELIGLLTLKGSKTKKTSKCLTISDPQWFNRGNRCSI